MLPHRCVAENPSELAAEIRHCSSSLPVKSVKVYIYLVSLTRSTITKTGKQRTRIRNKRTSKWHSMTIWPGTPRVFAPYPIIFTPIHTMACSSFPEFHRRLRGPPLPFLAKRADSAPQWQPTCLGNWASWAPMTGPETCSFPYMKDLGGEEGPNNVRTWTLSQSLLSVLGATQSWFEILCLTTGGDQSCCSHQVWECRQTSNVGPCPPLDLGFQFSSSGLEWLNNL